MLSARRFGRLSTVVRIASYLAICFIFAGLLGFLTDVVRDTSTVQATRITSPGETRVVTVTVDISEPDPSPTVEAVREREHSSAREVIDDVGDVLAAPFSWIAEGSDPWVRRLLYSALGLLLYGLGGQLLADWMRRFSDDSRRRARTEHDAAVAAHRKATGSYQSPA